MRNYEELVKRLREPCQYENCVLCKDAADAIEELSKRAEKYEKQVDCLFELVNDKDNEIDVLNVSLDTYQGLAEAMQNNQESEWILASEELPKDKEDVLVYLRHGEMAVDYFTESAWGYSTVTHWRPLPKPPKEENK